MVRQHLTWKRAYALALAVLLVFPACNVNVKKDDSGDDKNVDIKTPVGGLHVSKDVDPRDTGIAVYPGARLREDKDKDHDNANLGISTGLFGFKVIVVHYQTDDSSDKVLSFYRDQLKRYGNVLECHSHSGEEVKMEMGDKDKRGLKCDDNDSGTALELKVGTEENQHIVAVEPQTRGCNFTLVRLQMHGSKDSI